LKNLYKKKDIKLNNKARAADLGYNALSYKNLIKETSSKKHFINENILTLKFNRGFIKNGLKSKGDVLVSNSIYNFYSLFFIKELSSKFSKHQDFLIFSKSDSNFFKKIFILKRLVALLISPFFLKIEKISKKYKKIQKDSKIKYKYKVSYVPFTKRLNYLLKNFLIYVNTLKYFKLESRLTEALYNVVLEDKKSLLYKQKIDIIKRFKK
jgi:hypothetical protein